MKPTIMKTPTLHYYGEKCVAILANVHHWYMDIMEFRHTDYIGASRLVLVRPGERASHGNVLKY